MAEYNDAMTYKSRFHLICSCYRLPEDGSFTVGQEYAFSNTIDAVEIVDALGQVMYFLKKSLSLTSATLQILCIL